MTDALTFIPSLLADLTVPDNGTAWIFLFDDTGLAVIDGFLPKLAPKEAAAFSRGGLACFGSLGGLPCFAGRLDREKLADPISRISARAFYHQADDTFRQAVAFGRLVSDLHFNHQFCGRCSAPTRIMAGEHARECPDCGLSVYPRISPAVIMSVTRGDEILLARGVRFPNKKMFSVLAGFVSPGETLEDCVRREVFEETRIRVTHVQYVQSQPWPFPDSLMIGFTSEFETGEIRIDREEIVEAAWFKADALPLIPDSYSLAGRLIRSFVRQTTGKPLLS